MFYLSRKNSMGYETLYCTNGEQVGVNYCVLPGEFKMNRCPTVKTWKSLSGVKRWLAERPEFKAEIKTV